MSDVKILFTEIHIGTVIARDEKTIEVRYIEKNGDPFYHIYEKNQFGSSEMLQIGEQVRISVVVTKEEPVIIDNSSNTVIEDDFTTHTGPIVL